MSAQSSSRRRDCKLFRPCLFQLERRELLDAGPLGPLQPAALSFNYSTNAAGLPILHGLPSARAAIFLDFDGDGTNTPYDTDGSPSNFGTAEQAVIVEAWRQLSVYYSMFDIDVTTEQPPASRPKAWCIISNSISGGYTYTNTYPNSTPESFNQSGDGRIRQSGITHEAGHNLGLSHQSDYDLLGVKLNEYSSGFDNLHAPIMGVDYAQDIHKWFIGHPSSSPSTLQDDIAIIANKIRTIPTPLGDGFRPDEHAGVATAATPMQTIDGTQYGWGVIERMTDVDAFSFTVTGGNYTIAATPNSPSGLDMKMEIDAADGTMMALADSSTNTQQVGLNLPPGTYTVLLSSHGDYGDLGAYFLSVRPLPDGWDTRNIGRTIDGGYAGYDAATNTFAIGGSGSDIGGSADAFRFVYTPLTGNGEIVAHVDSLENTTSSAKAGVMVRDTLNADSRYALMAITSGSGAVFRRRTSTGGSSSTTTNSNPDVPYWVRLVRSGSTLTGYISSNGTNWTQVGSATINFGSTVYVGLAVSAAATSQANNLADATFSDVSLIGATGTPAPVYNSLPAPTNLTLNLGAATGIDLHWDAVEGASGYAVDRSADGVYWSQVATPTITTYSDASPGSSQRYFYRVSANDELGESPPSAVQSLVDRPSAPTSFVITSWQTSRLILNWRDVSGDTGYRIERSTNGGLTWSVIATVGTNVPSYTNTGLSTATQYLYRIVPLSPYGDGPSTDPIAGFTRLAAVTGVAIDNSTTGRINLQWNAATGATSYRVERSTDNTTFTAIGTPSTTSFSDTSVSALVEYYYRIVGDNSLTESTGPSATVFAASKPSNPVPSPWTDQDIGNVGGPGAAGFSGGAYTTIASGADVGGTADAFRFVYQTLTGDGSITSRINSQENTATAAKAGVMIRDTLAAGSRSAFLAITPAAGASFIRRTSTNGNSTTSSSAGPIAPYWARLVRSGSKITAFTSPDGATWTQVGSTTIAFGTTVYAGLAVSAGSNALLNTSRFDNVTVATSALPARVQSVQINDGSAQRSRVLSITATFNSIVTLPGDPASAFSLVRTGGGSVDLSASTSVVNGMTQVVLTFSGSETEASSLNDGNYVLTILAAQVSNGAGLLDGDGDGIAGGDSTTSLYRLYGDANGDRQVDNADFFLFRQTFGFSSSDPGYVSYFDSNGDVLIDNVDFFEFRSRFGTGV